MVKSTLNKFLVIVSDVFTLIGKKEITNNFNLKILKKENLMKYKLTFIALLFPGLVFAQSLNSNQINPISTTTHLGYDYYSGNAYASSPIKACSSALNAAGKNGAVVSAKCPDSYLGVMGYQGFVNGGGFKTIANPTNQVGQIPNPGNAISR